MILRDAIRFVVLHSLGNFLILISIYGAIATFGPALTAEVKFQVMQARGMEFTVAKESKAIKAPTTPHLSGFANILAGNKDQVLIPIDSLFSILILKIGVNVKVFPNVDPDNKKEYLSVLQHGVAHAKGSVFPGNPGTTYLFAHSADNWWDVGRYNAVFNTLNDLSQGDEIVIFFENRRYGYEVTQKIISDPQDIALLTSKHEGPQRLVLQTCWPPGTTWKRLYIIAVPKSSR